MSTVYPSAPTDPPASQPFPNQAFYNPPPGNTATTVITTQPGNVAVPGSTCFYHQMPCLIQCQHCGSVVTTSTEYKVGTFAWLIGGILCLVGCDLGCCLIPCCMGGCKDVIHTCPNCHQPVGRYNRL